MFDCSVIHSFASLDCASRLGMPVSCLHYDHLAIETPTSDYVDTFGTCFDCPIFGLEIAFFTVKNHVIQVQLVASCSLCVTFPLP
jgi:hypothetical protein